RTKTVVKVTASSSSSRLRRLPRWHCASCGDQPTHFESSAATPLVLFVQPLQLEVPLLTPALHLDILLLFISTHSISRFSYSRRVSPKVTGRLFLSLLLAFVVSQNTNGRC